VIDEVNALRALIVSASLALIAGGSLLSLTTGASAHERRAVGEYTLVVGWVGEPALQNIPNSVDFRVSRTADESPVEGLEETVKVTISYEGAEPLEKDLAARFRTPGAYNAYLTPTETGAYTFHFTGEIDGMPLDETFTASDDTFGLIEAPEGYPAALPAVQDLEQRVVDLEDDSGSDNGTLFGIIGIAFGIAGLAVGGFSLTRKGS
jgi:hypothetical protein